MKSAIERCKQCGRVICDCGLIERWNDECQQAPAAVIEGVKYLCLNEDALQRISAALSSATPAVEGLREFEEWLNERRMHDVSFVFHDIVAKYAAALAASPEPLSADAGAQEVAHYKRLFAASKLGHEQAFASSQRAHSALSALQRDLNVMLASAVPEGVEWVEGYRIKTGALHRIIGTMQEAGYSVVLPNLVSTPSQSAPGEAEQVCYEAYQVVGSMLIDLGQFDTERAGKILDNLSQAKKVHDDVLPWPSFEATTHSAPVAGMTLTNEQIYKLCGVENRDSMMKHMAVYCARAIEAALREKAGGK